MGRTVTVVKYKVEKSTARKAEGKDGKLETVISWDAAHNVVLSVGGERVELKDADGVHELTAHEVAELKAAGLRVTKVVESKGKK